MYKRGRKKYYPYSKFSDILKRVHTEVYKAMVTELWRFQMPHTKLEFYVKEMVGQRRPVDWVSSKKFRKLVRHNNMHTGGRLFKITMRKNGLTPRILSPYKFIPTRGNKDRDWVGNLGLARHIKACSKDPLVPDYRAHID
jgi:hypothetical protein